MYVHQVMSEFSSFTSQQHTVNSVNIALSHFFILFVSFHPFDLLFKRRIRIVTMVTNTYNYPYKNETATIVHAYTIYGLKQTRIVQVVRYFLIRVFCVSFIWILRGAFCLPFSSLFDYPIRMMLFVGCLILLFVVQPKFAQNTKKN